MANHASEHTIPAVDKTVALLTRLGDGDGGMSQGELAAELDISSSTCYRILQTLLARDWIRKENGNRYDLALPFRRVSRKLDDRMRRYQIMRPVLEALARESGLACKLSVREGDRQYSLLRAESPRPIAVSGKIGMTYPLAEGSVGAALLSRTPARERDRLAKRCAVELGAADIPDLLAAGVEAIRQQGYCFNRGRNRWRIDALSAPVPPATDSDDDNAVAAALTLLGHDEDFVDLDGLGRALLRRAGECGGLLAQGGV